MGASVYSEDPHTSKKGLFEAMALGAIITPPIFFVGGVLYAATLKLLHMIYNALESLFHKSTG